MFALGYLLKQTICELLIKAAHVGANRSWRYMHVAAEEKAVGVLLWHLRRQIGGAAARANAAFLLGRVSFAAGGSTNPAAAQESEAAAAPSKEPSAVAGAVDTSGDSGARKR